MTTHLQFPRQAGFTLLETLIAVLILSGGIMVVAHSWSGNALRLEKARINNNVAFLLQRKMAEYELRLQEKSYDEVPEEEAGEFEGFKGFTWKMKSKS